MDAGSIPAGFVGRKIKFKDGVRTHFSVLAPKIKFKEKEGKTSLELKAKLGLAAVAGLF